MQVVREIELPAPVEEVWEALTDPERLEEWFANEVELDVREGGEGRFRWDDGDLRRAIVEEVVPLERLAFRWHGEGGDEGRVAIELERHEGATVVRVTESANAGWATALGLRAMALVAVA